MLERQPEFMTTSRYVRNGRVAWQIIDNEAVLIDLGSGDTVGLNATGGLIWSQIDEHPVDEIVAQLASRFDLPASDAQRDVAEFVESLAASGLLIRKDAE